MLNIQKGGIVINKQARRRAVKQYANRIWYLLEKGVSKRKVRDLMYSQREKHIKLDIKEETLDIIWESLMEGTFDPEDPIVLKSHR